MSFDIGGFLRTVLRTVLRMMMSKEGREGRGSIEVRTLYRISPFIRHVITENPMR